MQILSKKGVKKKNHQTWKNICQIFNLLPYACIIESKIFCVHGGLSPMLTSPCQLENIDRGEILLNKSLESDLVWSVPQTDIWGFEDTPFGIGYYFGEDVTEKFLLVNELEVLVRSNEILTQGFEVKFEDKLVDLCSIPNFQGKYGNCGAIMIVNEDIEIQFVVIRPANTEGLFKKINLDTN